MIIGYRLRFLALAILALGFPAWFIYWVHSPNVSAYLYAILGYAALIIYLLATAMLNYLK
jgi:hypothetical protein